MGLLTRLYDRLAEGNKLDWLMTLGMYDERVYETVDRHRLIPVIVETLPSPFSAQFLARGMCYDSVNDEVIGNFIRICVMLSRYNTVKEGVALSFLIGSCGLPEKHRMQMFNFSDTYRHMILSHSYFSQRAVLRLLSYIFCDNVHSDAVAQLQYNSGISNYINKIYLETPDFVSWRFSVRCMSLTGGFNEDRSNVERTEFLTRVVTQIFPEFFTYFFPAFFYARFRFYPRYVRSIIPRGLVHQRAFFSAMYCGLLGIYCNSILEYRIHTHRVLYELRKSQEYIRRHCAAREGVVYVPNPYFNSLEGITQQIFVTQLTTYSVTAFFLFSSLLSFTRVTFPKFMGDVAWRYPFLPRLFPALLGMPAVSRCLVPFVFAPFTVVFLMRLGNVIPAFYEYYVEMRMRM